MKSNSGIRRKGIETTYAVSTELLAYTNKKGELRYGYKSQSEGYKATYQAPEGAIITAHYKGGLGQPPYVITYKKIWGGKLEAYDEKGKKLWRRSRALNSTSQAKTLLRHPKTITVYVPKKK